MNKEDGDSLPQDTFRVIDGLSIAPASTEWLWPGWIARSSLCIVTGHPDTGKSWLLLHLASEITRRNGKVLLIDSENAAAQVLIPRLEILGANLEGINIHDCMTTRHGNRHFNLSRDIRSLETHLAANKYELVSIDPLNAYLGLQVDSYRDASIRTVLGPLARIADNYNLSIVAIVHGTKAAAELPLYRIQGSIAYGAAARTVILVARESESDRRTIMLLKNNLVPEPEKPKPLNFDLSCGFRWLGESPPKPQSVPPPTKITEAEAFLERLLADGPLPTAEVIAAAGRARFKERTLELARASLGIKAFQRERQWYLAATRELPHTAEVEPQRDESPPRAPTVERCRCGSTVRSTNGRCSRGHKWEDIIA